MGFYEAMIFFAFLWIFGGFVFGGKNFYYFFGCELNTFRFNCFNVFQAGAFFIIHGSTKSRSLVV